MDENMLPIFRFLHECDPTQFFEVGYSHTNSFFQVSEML